MRSVVYYWRTCRIFMSVEAWYPMFKLADIQFKNNSVSTEELQVPPTLSVFDLENGDEVVFMRQLILISMLESSWGHVTPLEFTNRLGTLMGFEPAQHCEHDLLNRLAIYINCWRPAALKMPLAERNHPIFRSRPLHYVEWMIKDACKFLSPALGDIAPGVELGPPKDPSSYGCDTAYTSFLRKLRQPREPFDVIPRAFDAACKMHHTAQMFEELVSMLGANHFLPDAAQAMQNLFTAALDAARWYDVVIVSMTPVIMQLDGLAPFRLQLEEAHRMYKTAAIQFSKVVGHMDESLAEFLLSHDKLTKK